MHASVRGRGYSSALVAGLAVAVVALLVAAASASAAGFGQLGKWGSFGSEDGEFTTPTFVEVNEANDEILVADFDPNGIPNTFRIQRFGQDGAFKGKFAEQTGDPSIDLFFQAFGGMAADSQRDVLYLTRPTDDGVDPTAPSFVERYKLSTGEKLSNFSSDASFNGSNGLLKPTAIAVDESDGSVYIGGKDSSGQLKVQRFASNGTAGTRFGASGAAAGRFFAAIQAIDVAPNGEVVIADVDPDTQFLGRVQRFKADGTFVSGFKSTPAHPFFARDLAQDDLGNVFVDHAAPGVVNGNSVTGGGVIKFSAQGTELKRFGSQAASPAAGACELGGARLHLAVDKDDRDVVVADAGGARNTVRQAIRFGRNGTGCGDFRELSIGDAGQITEGNSGTTDATFTVTLAGGPAAGPVTVDYTTVDGTAKQPGDYEAASGTVTIPAGESSATVTVKVKGETAFEQDEGFEVRLSNPSGADIDDDRGSATIANDDTQPPPPPRQCNAIEQLVDTITSLLGQPRRC